MKRYCLALDIADDPELIAEYKRHHQNIWPEVVASIRNSGVRDLEIYLLGTRLVMFIEVDDSFSFDKKADADRSNPKVQQWEQLMWKFQRPLPQAKPGEKWVLMEKIFKLESSRTLNQELELPR